MELFTRAAYISSTRNLNGGVVCRAADGLPFLLRPGQQVHFVPPSLYGPRKAQVTSVKELSAGAWEVFFTDVDTIDAAEDLVGTYCLVSDKELPEQSATDNKALLCGFAVQDGEYGTLGVVEDVLASPAQVTLDIAGPYGQVLLPLVDEFIEHLDEEAHVVYTHIPEGLLRLNTSRQTAEVSIHPLTEGAFQKEALGGES